MNALDDLLRRFDDPLVRELRARVSMGNLVPPDVDIVPSWFPEWGRAAALTGQVHLARLAGLVLRGTDSDTRRLAAVLVWPAARAADLEVLAAGFDASELRPLFTDLRVARGALPVEVADALVAIALPHNLLRASALGMLAQHLDLLQGLEVSPGGVVAGIATMMHTLAEERRSDREAARPHLERMIREVEIAAVRLSTVGMRLGVVDVERAIEKIGGSGVSIGLLEAATAAGEALPALHRLLLFLALRREVVGTAHEPHWQALLAKLASDSICALREPALFELRLRLLDEAIEAARSPISIAELYFQRATTRRVVAAGDERSVDQVLRDLKIAIGLGHAEGNLRLRAAAASAVGKIVAWNASGDSSGQPERLIEAQSAVVEALALPLEPFDRATLYQAQAHLVRLRSPVDSIAVFEAALGLLASGESFWVEICAEIVATLVRAERSEDAVQCGTEYLQQARSDGPSIELGMLRLALGEALAATGRWNDARRQLEEGLQLVRGRDKPNELLARLHLARLGLASGNHALAEEQLRFLQDHSGELDTLMRRDVDRLAVEAIAARGDRDEQRAMLDRLVSTAREDGVRVGLRLEIARLDLAAGRVVDGLDRLVELGLETELEQHSEAVLTEVLCNHGGALAPFILEKALPWAGSRRPSVVARLQHQLGRTEQARDTLHVALDGELGGHERLGCTHQLMTLLDMQQREKRRALCEELERLLDVVEDIPHIRLDLAAGMWLTAGDDLSRILRARVHARRALEVVPSPVERAHGHRILGRITVDLLRLSLPRSSPSLAQEASWLLEALALSEPEASQLRLAVVSLLLVPGPLAHPDALIIAERMLGLVATPPDQRAFGAVEERLRWVRDLAGSAVARPSTGLHGPFDELPRWMVDHVHGRGGPVSPGEIARVASMLVPLVQTRPDLADSLLAIAISVQHQLPARPRQGLFDAVYAAVQCVGDGGTETWPRLRGVLDGVQKRHQHPMLANLQSATRRSERRDPRVQQVTPTERKTVTKMRVGGRQRATACFERGVALMASLQLDPYAADAGLWVGEARTLLAEAVAIARKKRMPELLDFLVSYGNAWKMDPKKDVEKALRIYAAAEKLNAAPAQKSKLWKVQADALRLRGTADDLRRAERLLERACSPRRGRWLAETLMSRAQVALVHPDLDGAAREREAASFAMDAVRADRGFGDQDNFVGFLLHRLAAWQRHAPDDPGPARVREELKASYPSRADQIDRQVPHGDGRDLESIVAVMAHPAGAAFLKVRTRMMSASERGQAPWGLLDSLGPSVKEAAAKQGELRSLIDRPDEAERVFESLAQVPGDAALPGVLAARVVLLAYLARVGRRSVNEVRVATSEAIAAMGDLDDVLVSAMLLREVALAWSPNDHAEDPVRDFGLAVDLLRRCVEMERGEANAVGDTLSYLARALRYSPAGDPQRNLREARRLYQLRLEQARASDGPDVIANVLHNLADIENHLGTGSRVERLFASEKLIEEAVTTAQSSHRKARCLASLAWVRTQLGHLLGGAEGRRYLEKAIATFHEVDPMLLEESERRNVEDNRSVCEATLAWLVGGRAAAVAFWRELLAKIDAAAAPYRAATAKHNLANALVRGEELSRDAVAEGLELWRDAAQVRTLEANPRHHWETSLAIGCSILEAVASRRHCVLSLPPEQAAAEADLWLRRAVTAARVLGPGEELLDAAFALCSLATGESTPDRFIERIEEAWKLVREASSYLPIDTDIREREAWSATSLAAHLAYKLAAHAIAVAASGIAFVLQGEEARLVERWIVRAQQPVRRPLQARLSRPRSVPAAVWDVWQRAIGSRDQRRLADALEQVRATAPSFFSEDQANEETWRWLEARPGSIAVALVRAEPVSLALLMRAGETGERRSWVLGLELALPPISPEELTTLMRGGVVDPSANGALDALARWGSRGIVEPIERFIGEVPSAVLWSPGPGLRLVPPGAIWGSVPVATTTSLVLPERSLFPSRSRSSLLMLADPGADGGDPRLSLHGQGVPALEVLERAAARRGPVRLLGSVGACFGRSLLGDRAEVRDTPASACDVLLEAKEHEVIVLIAHGEVETLEDAAVLCIDASGSIDRLAIAQLGRSPEAFAGSTVLLLSCEGGRMGDSLSDPGGLAGTLLSAGAACVVAPLRPVRLDIAEQVGRAVLEGISAGEEPWSVLAKLHLHENRGSPSLGRPAPSRAERSAEQAFQRLAFVAWVG